VAVDDAAPVWKPAIQQIWKSALQKQRRTIAGTFARACRHNSNVSARQFGNLRYKSARGLAQFRTLARVVERAVYLHARLLCCNQGVQITPRFHAGERMLKMLLQKLTIRFPFIFRRLDLFATIRFIVFFHGMSSASESVWLFSSKQKRRRRLTIAVSSNGSR
jgi:hypothetical protein